MMNPDGSPMTKRQVIVERRGAFKWLPVICSNDLEHGSWWFVWGSLFTALCAIYPIYTKNAQRDAHNDDFLPVTDFDLTWAMVICSGVFFTLGSLAFVRAFSEPPQQPLLHNYKHFQTDELLGAWLFLIGTVPGVPYMLIFFLIQPTAFYFFGMIAAVVFVLASYLFVASCYPSDKVNHVTLLTSHISLMVTLPPSRLRNMIMWCCHSSSRCLDLRCGLSNTWRMTGWLARGSSSGPMCSSPSDPSFSS